MIIEYANELAEKSGVEMAERTKGLMALNILQLITAAAVCAIAVILVLIDVGWSELSEFLNREYWGLFSVFLLY